MYLVTLNNNSIINVKLLSRFMQVHFFVNMNHRVSASAAGSQLIVCHNLHTLLDACHIKIYTYSLAIQLPLLINNFALKTKLHILSGVFIKMSVWC